MAIFIRDDELLCAPSANVEYFWRLSKPEMPKLVRWEFDQRRFVCAMRDKHLGEGGDDFDFDEVQGIETWIMGYFSAMSMGATNDDFDGSVILAAIRNHCQNNPASTIADSAFAVSVQLYGISRASEKEEPMPNVRKK